MAQDINNSRRPSEASNENSGNDGSSASSDTASKVFSQCQFWCVAQVWHMKKATEGPSNDSSFIQFTGPHASEEMLQLYRDRQLKGSNIIVGLAPEAKHFTGDEIPATFYRTLAYLFELAKSGATYQGVTEKDIHSGKPDNNWCKPLWTVKEPRRSPSGGQLEPKQLFASAPWWCYLYSHEQQRAKKTPPKTSQQMFEMYRAGLLPDWTPVLGLEDDVSKFNSLPPSLFMTLASLLQLVDAGYALKPVGLKELQLYDKFIDSRGANGTTQGMMHGGLTITTPHLGGQSGMHGGPPHSPTSAGFMPMSPMGSPGGPQGNFMPFPPYAMVHAPTTPMMWYGPYGPMYPPGCPYPGGGFPGPDPRGNMDMAAGPMEAYAGHGPPDTPTKASSAVKGQAGNGGPGANGRNNGAHPARGQRAHSAPLSAAAAAAAMGMMGPMMAPGPGPMQMPCRWHTPVFQLFTADGSRGMFEAAWWYMSAVDGAASGIVGPLSCEQMILSYARGNLTDKHLVCGTTCNVPPNHPPPVELFEPIGQLLYQVEQGGNYMLVTYQEILEHGSKKAAEGGKPGAPPAPAPAAPKPQAPQQGPKGRPAQGARNDSHRGSSSSGDTAPASRPYKVGRAASKADAAAAAAVAVAVRQHTPEPPTSVVQTAPQVQATKA